MKTLDRKAHAQEWAHLVDLLQEICDHAKHLQVQQRHALFLSLSKFPNLIGMVTYALRRRRGAVKSHMNGSLQKLLT